MNLTEQLRTGLADFKNPFSPECVSAVYIEIHPGRTFGRPISARVHFKNGNTGGSQNFEGDSLPVVCQQIDDFVKGLGDGTSD